MDKFITKQVEFWLCETMRKYFGNEVDNLNWNNFNMFVHNFSEQGFKFIENEKTLTWKIEKDGKIISTFKPELNFNKE